METSAEQIVQILKSHVKANVHALLQRFAHVQGILNQFVAPMRRPTEMHVQRSARILKWPVKENVLAANQLGAHVQEY